MLRVMKQKILEDHGELPLSFGSDNAPTTFVEDCDNQAVVSHVPVSVCSETCESAESSISSFVEDGSCDINMKYNMELKRQRQSALLVTHELYAPESSSWVENNCTRTSKLETSTTKRHLTSEMREFLSEEIYPAPKKQKINPENQTAAPLKLLRRPDDEANLNALHIFVRSQIEVFTATEVELSQPAPGRKQPIKLHQVGLRCIHCRNLPTRTRVKRAVCYPTNVGRLYHSVSDMKFDHFSKCQAMPANLQAKLHELKVESKKGKEKKTSKASSSSSTAQYYHESALNMGMVNGPSGIFMAPTPSNTEYLSLMALSNNFAARQNMAIRMMFSNPPSLQEYNLLKNRNGPSPSIYSSSTLKKASTSVKSSCPQDTLPKLKPSISSRGHSCTVELSEEQDTEHLNKLHCFIRKHIEIFSATKEDIDAPAPGRKTRLVLGQIGIRCRHCAKLPPKERVKRAVCYPPSVSGIYHSVSNMKFDHFGKCRGLPQDVRKEFEAVKAACSRRGSPSSKTAAKGPSGSTAQYYHKSALRKGLYDTETGIRFVEEKLTKKSSREIKTKPKPNFSGLSALMLAACQASK